VTVRKGFGIWAAKSNVLRDVLILSLWAVAFVPFSTFFCLCPYFSKIPTEYADEAAAGLERLVEERTGV
jgi:hypothetical protein